MTSNPQIMTWEAAVDWLRAQPDYQELVKACYYDQPLQAAAERFVQSEEWQAVCQVLQPWLPGRVLDLGAGNGIASYGFARLGCDVIALEPDPSFSVGAGAIAQLAHDTGMPMQVVQGVGEGLPFSDQSFDIVHGRQVLHHASDLPRLCQEVARVLRPQGVFIATREHVISKPEDLATFLTSHPLHCLYGGENALVLAQYQQAFYAAHLVLQQIYGSHDSVINYFPTTQVQHQASVRKGLQKVLGQFLADWLLAHTPALTWINRYRSWCDQTPGRLYSFIAIKPN